MDPYDYTMEGYIIDDDGNRVSPNLKMKDMQQVATLADIVFRSKFNLELRKNPELEQN